MTEGSLGLALAAALFLGLRHATDPDHLTAVATLVLSEKRTARRAGVLGLFWGFGHATTLFLIGLPVVLLGARLPEIVHRGAEFAVGVMIVALAARVLIRWRRGVFHSHSHAHGNQWHAHPHGHERAHDPDAVLAIAAARSATHDHAHAEDFDRSPIASYGVGLLHGLGGTAGVGVFMAAAAPDPATAAMTLALFAAATAVSMALLSSALGFALAREAIAVRLALLVPPAGLLGVLFGAWYALGALGVIPGDV